jgi:hypothetical protein
MRLGATREIERPAAEVFEFIAEVTNNPTWQKGMRHCEWISPAPTGVGSQYRQRASFLGRTVVSVFEVIEFEPGSRIVIETIESTFPIRVERRVESIDKNFCRVFAEIEGGPSVPRFLQGLIGKLAQRSVTGDYNRLVEHLGT